MDTILVAIVVLVLIIMSTLLMTVSVFQSADTLGDAWKNMEEQSASISETEINALFNGSYTGGLIDTIIHSRTESN